jgi:hypothetical protein
LTVTRCIGQAIHIGGEFIKSARDKDRGGDSKSANLNHEYQHAGERAILETNLLHQREEGDGVQGVVSCLQCLEDCRGEGCHQWSIRRCSFQTQAGDAAINIGWCVNPNILGALFDIGIITQSMSAFQPMRYNLEAMPPRTAPRSDAVAAPQSMSST